MLTQSTIGDSGVGDSSGSLHESPTNKAQVNLIYPDQLLGIQALGIQALGIRAVHRSLVEMYSAQTDPALMLGLWGSFENLSLAGSRSIDLTYI